MDESAQPVAAADFANRWSVPSLGRPEFEGAMGLSRVAVVGGARCTIDMLAVTANPSYAPHIRVSGIERLELRYMLAWSLDRTAPKAIGDVSDRFHTPVKAIVFATITGGVALIALTTQAKASLLGALLAQILAFIVVSVAGIGFPYRLREVWESAGGHRILGVPAVTLAGIGGVIGLGGILGIFIFNHTINTTFAVTRRLSLEFMIGVIVIGVIWYAAAWAYNRSRGIDLGNVYRESPPE